jgi:tetratricopeptide (TPR) repeat protein
MAGETILDLFVSSPGDVRRERERVDLVVERLNAEYTGRVRIRTIRWETRYYSSHDTFQTQIPEASECDLVLAIFGARLGSPLPDGFPPMPSGDRYPSGTAYEVLSAMEARRSGKGIPDIYVFRRPTAPSVALDAADRDEIETQWRRLTGFFETWFRDRGGQFLAAFQEFASTDEFALKVEDCLRQWLARRGFPARAAVWDRRANGSPYPGLAAFDESRRAVFFGREVVIEQALRRLRDLDAPADAGGDGGVPFLLMIGASGSGKSSLLRAGLIPRVGLPGVLPDVDLWRPTVVVPGADPFGGLAEALVDDRALGEELRATPFGDRGLLAKLLAGDPDTAIAPVAAALAAAAETRRREGGFETARPARLFVAIDQAERLFFESDPEVQGRFARLVAELCRRRLATVVVALRSDAYPRFQALDAFVALRSEGATLDLLPATANELEEMATRPAAICDPPLVFERRDGRSLASVLVAEAHGGDALPLLQMTLSRLAAAEATRGDGVLRFDDFPGLGEAVRLTADEALAELDAAARAEVPNLVAGLVRDYATDPVDGRPRPVIGALDRTRFEAGRPERRALIDCFVAHRLLTADGDAGGRRVRPTHESLLRIWPEAVTILAETAHLIRARAAVEPLARDWAEAAEADRARHLEISPALLDAALAWTARFGEEASEVTRAFVAAAAAIAEARRDRERAERDRRIADAEAIARAKSRIARTTGIGLAAALLLAALAGWQWRATALAEHEAQAQRDRAERTLAAATATADGLVFDLAQKFRNLSGVPKPIVESILTQARRLQEQLIGFGERSSKLTGDHAAALGELAATELALGDTPQALALAERSRADYERLVGEAPDDPRFVVDLAHTDDLIGQILTRQGRIDDAEAAYRRAENGPAAALARGLDHPNLPQVQSTAIEHRGALARDRGDLTAARELYRRSLALAVELVARRPNDAAVRHNLAVAHRSLGDVELEENDLDAADADFAAAAEIAGRLAAARPDDTLLQRDFTLSQERLGLTLMKKKDVAAALVAFRAGEATALALSDSDPANLEWRFDASIGHREIGDAERARGDLTAAARAYAAARAIDTVLVARDPSNANWRSHLDDVLDRLADVAEKTGAGDEAITAHRERLALGATRLSEHPDDTEWRRRANDAERRIGRLLVAADRPEEAIGAFRRAADGARRLAPDRTARRMLVGDLVQIGGLAALADDDAAANGSFDEGERVARGLVAEDPKDTSARGDLALLLVGSALSRTRVGRSDDAVAGLREAIALVDGLAAATPGDSVWPAERATALDRLGDALAARGDGDGAIDAYRRSLAAGAALPAATRDGRSARVGRAMTAEALAGLLDGAGRPGEALAAVTEAIAARRGLAESADRSGRRALLADLNLAGRLRAVTGDAAAALADWREGLELARSLAPTPEAEADRRHDLAISLYLVGSERARTGDPAGAAADLGEALPIALRLAAEAPGDSGFARFAATVARDLGAARLAGGDRAGALRAFVAARDADRSARAAADMKLDVTRIGVTAAAMFEAGDYEAALAALDEATPVAPDQNWLDLIRAGALMFLDRPDRAKALFLAHRGERVVPSGRSWEAETLEALTRLKARGKTHPLIAEIEAAFAAP